MYSRLDQDSGVPKVSDVVVKVADFSDDPIPRLREEGPDSGEEFREDVLIDAFEKAVRLGVRLVIDLDGTYGVPPSFREESFGGLVRYHLSLGKHYDYENIIVFKSEDRPALGELARNDIRRALSFE